MSEFGCINFGLLLFDMGPFGGTKASLYPVPRRRYPRYVDEPGVANNCVVACGVVWRGVV